MSRLTGSDALGLFEAYQAVYAPQELTEEQVWEEVENWVNSLIEEGYDLSDYTWEEMYEDYIEERDVVELPGGKSVTTGQGYDATLGGQPGKLTYQRTPGSRNRVQRSFTANPVLSKKGGVEGSGVGKDFTPQAWSPGASRRFDAQTVKAKQDASNATQPAGSPPAGSPPPRPAAPVLSKKDGVEGTGVGANFKARAFTDAERSRYTSVAAKNAAAKPAAAPAKPAATAPTTPNPTPAASPRPKDTSITDMIGRSQVRQGAPVNTGSSSSDARAMAARSSVGTATASPSSTTSTPTPAAAPKPNLQQSIRARRLNMSFDLFDVIKGHLLDEGYADTEESALAIMANMSEEWRESILSEDPVQDYRDMKRSQENAAGMRGPELSHSSKGTPKPGSATMGSKGTPKPGSAPITNKPRSREFTNPPS
jgi:hypothetical protein